MPLIHSCLENFFLRQFHYYMLIHAYYKNEHLLCKLFAKISFIVIIFNSFLLNGKPMTLIHCFLENFATLNLFKFLFNFLYSLRVIPIPLIHSYLGFFIVKFHYLCLFLHIIKKRNFYSNRVQICHYCFFTFLSS